ncbi:hypothetical protein Nepgr_025626 [Nepenthes gracilis]|uniref:Survival protein SurE-like phosphatase/nucleotidase domain-containing protein n=1 Tax=Nepenthes gracilis TaxID=150966 RepID=A0AAD3T6P3_NEPGR|nr:hypothetical protein Nepgr_025626 [Nepenthes gracilis]
MSINKDALQQSLVANLQRVLISRNNGQEEETNSKEASSFPSSAAEAELEEKNSKPVVLVTNADGIESPGLVCLVQGLVRDGRFDVHVCAPQSDKSASGHSLTVRKTVEVSSAEIGGATAYEVSGTPADCVSLALSEALFSWSKPLLVISGINRGSICGQNMLYSGAIAGAREAMICGVPSLCISLNWKNGVSSENDFKDSVDVCLPLIHVAIRDIEMGVFPNGCLLNIEVPVSPSANKGFRATRQSLWRSGLSWQAVSAYKHPSSGHFMTGQQSLGIQLALLGRDASAAGAARRLNNNKKIVEIESVGAAGKPSSQQSFRKYFCLEFVENEKDQEDVDEDLDFRALENGFVTITPLALSSDVQPKIQSSVSGWLKNALPIQP